MKVGMMIKKIRVIAIVLTAGLALWQISLRVQAQKIEKPRTAHPANKTDSRTGNNKTEAAANNAEYAIKVKEYTTQPYFMTEFVDHLPASDKVPSPDKVLGYTIGAPGHLTYTEDMYRDYSELEKARARMAAFVGAR